MLVITMDGIYTTEEHATSLIVTLQTVQLMLDIVCAFWKRLHLSCTFLPKGVDFPRPGGIGSVSLQ